MAALFRERVVVNLPLVHRACCLQIASPIRFASSMSSLS
jgi:hypothetical protein